MSSGATRPDLFLASASPRRRQLLEQIGIVPDGILVPDVDETPLPDELPRPYARRLADAKLAAALPALPPNAVLLAADTVVALGRRILPKAEDEATARRCLTLLSGRRHTVLTAVVLRWPDGATSHRTVESVVAFSRLLPAQIDALLAAGDWRGKAGGYAIQGHAAAFTRFLSGSHSNVVGLPLFEVAQLLRGRAWLP
ncbi:MAG: septum formation protein Maf [Gluconacetobacter diazotrophicus]|nr:septum formation protein Maf [Gluconacetobacter diazotrophicus]